MCPQAAMYQHGYRTRQIGQEWKLADDYTPLPHTCTWRELAEFCENQHEKSICRLCPEQYEEVGLEEKFHVTGLKNSKYQSSLLQLNTNDIR